MADETREMEPNIYESNTKLINIQTACQNDKIEDKAAVGLRLNS